RGGDGGAVGRRRTRPGSGRGARRRRVDPGGRGRRAAARAAPGLRAAGAAGNLTARGVLVLRGGGGVDGRIIHHGHRHGLRGALLVRPLAALVVVTDLVALGVGALVPVGHAVGGGVEVRARSPALRGGGDRELEVVAVLLEAPDHRVLHRGAG